MLGFLNRLFQPRRPRSGPDTHACRVRLSLERLEDRLTPSVSGDQEYMLQLINRMRTDPADELPLLLNSNNADVNNALTYFKVNIQTLKSQWATLTPVAPLAWSDALAQSATDHSQLMLTDDTQSHQLPGEADPGTRMANAGFAPANTFDWGENIFASSNSVFEGHAAFAIDWGSTSTGIQNPPGHRENLMDGSFQQVGIGLVQGSGQQVGPLLITQDFGGLLGQPTPFLVGAVFNDANGNGFYDSGEGLNGVTVTITDQNGNSVTTTTGAAGDYQLQLSAGTYTVTASGGDLGSTSLPAQTVTVGSSNVLLNFNAANTSGLATPALTGPTSPVASSTPTFTWTDSSADHYELRVNDNTTGTTGLLDAQDVTSTSFTPTTPLLAGHQYTALVRAFDGSGNATGWSAPFTFTIVLPAAPAATGPTGPVHTTFPTITWAAVAGADHYDLWVNDSTTGKGQVIRQQDVTDTSFTPTAPLLFGHQYTARVQAVNAAGQSGQWGKWFHFSVTRPPAPAVPTVTGPTGSGVSQTPAITWTDVAGADHYDLRVDDLTTGTTQVIRQQDLTTTSFTPTSALLSGHRYKVLVRSFDSLGQTRGWSKAELFTVL